MWICKRNPGESIEMKHLGYVNTVKLVRVIGGQHAWIIINGEPHGPLAAGTEIEMFVGKQTWIRLAIVRFKGQEVTISVNASKEVELRAVK